MNPAPPETPDTYTSYLVVFFLTFFGIIGAVWIYTANLPVAFMESGYASWAAKTAMLRQCRIGQIAFFGDSRLEAGLMPARFPVSATNFGLAAGTAVEARVGIERALACPTPPQQVVISLAPEHFGPLSNFYWLLSIRYGYLTVGDVLAVERLADQLGDADSLAIPTPEGLSGRPRDWLYAAHFPSLSFSSLIQGRVFGRYASNKARMAEVERDRGWAAYAGGNKLKAEHPDRFILTKLQNAELEAALDALRRKGIPAALLIMPYAADHQETDATLTAYRDYLAAMAQRTGATLLDPTIPIWPQQPFDDGAHLNIQGAEAFTRSLGACLKDGLLQASCPLPPP